MEQKTVRVVRFEGVAVLREDAIQLEAELMLYGNAYLEPAGMRIVGPAGAEMVYRRFNPAVHDVEI